MREPMTNTYMKLYFHQSSSRHVSHLIQACVSHFVTVNKGRNTPDLFQVNGHLQIKVVFYFFHGGPNKPQFHSFEYLAIVPQFRRNSPQKLQESQADLLHLKIIVGCPQVFHFWSPNGFSFFLKTFCFGTWVQFGGSHFTLPRQSSDGI